MKNCLGCGSGTMHYSGYCGRCKRKYIQAIHTLVNRDFLIDLAIDTGDEEWFLQLSRIMVVGEIEI